MIQNREDIIRIEGQLKLINQKLDNHIHHISGKVDTIFRIVWTVSFGVLALIMRAAYVGIMGCTMINYYSQSRNTRDFGTPFTATR